MREIKKLQVNHRIYSKVIWNVRICMGVSRTLATFNDVDPKEIIADTKDRFPFE